MCFSAEASFGAGAVLLGIGIISLVKAKSIPYKVLACIPLLFSIQQFDEGIIWLSFADAAFSRWQPYAIFIFLLFAQVIWPVFLPFSILQIETSPYRKRLLRIILGAGVLLAAYLLYSMFAYDITASVAGQHIRYDFSYPYKQKWYSGLLYLLPTVLAPLASTHWKIRVIGALILLTYLISRLFFGEYLISVWCYFATIISVVVLLVVIESDNRAGAEAR